MMMEALSSFVEGALICGFLGLTPPLCILLDVALKLIIALPHAHRGLVPRTLSESCCQNQLTSGSTILLLHERICTRVFNAFISHCYLFNMAFPYNHETQLSLGHPCEGDER